MKKRHDSDTIPKSLKLDMLLLSEIGSKMNTANTIVYTTLNSDGKPPSFPLGLPVISWLIPNTLFARITTSYVITISQAKQVAYMYKSILIYSTFSRQGPPAFLVT